jgi:hypothetical protein
MAAAAPAPAVPHADVTLTVGSASLADDARALCVRLVPGWAALAPADVAVTVISGGITNSLMKARATRCAHARWRIRAHAARFPPPRRRCAAAGAARRVGRGRRRGARVRRQHRDLH